MKKLLFILMLLAAPAWGQMHHPASQAIAMQTIVNRPSVSLTANAPAVQVDPADSRRIYALCTVTGSGTNAVDFGDSTTNATSGMVLLSSDPPTAFATNDAIYAFTTTSNTVVECIDFDLK